MSKYYRDNGEIYTPEYNDGRTQQSWKDQCDINKILKRAEVKGGLSHVQKYDKAVYGEFDPDLDLFVARERIQRATEIFGELPAEVRREFNNDPISFVTYANQVPAEELIQRIPQIAEPGGFFPNPVKRGGLGAGEATALTRSEAAHPPNGSPPDSTPAPSPDSVPSPE